MTFETLGIFIIACAVLALTPGPAMTLLLANTTLNGRSAGLYTLGGNTLGLCLLVFIATLGMNSIMVFMSEWFDWLRWVGALYLVWLGGKSLWDAFASSAHKDTPEKPGRHYFRQGLFISLSNPKVLLFLGAFFPQFINQNNNLTSQLVVLALLFIMVIAFVDLCTVLVASKVMPSLTDKKRRFAGGISGSLLILGGFWLATARKN